jgi:hypothetical protein
MLSPGYPAEMPYYVRGLAAAGAHVLGVGDQPEHVLPALTREHLAGYFHLPQLWDHPGAIDAVRRWVGPARVERVECLWEPGVLLAARLREALDAPGLSFEQAVPFRDKDRMKRVLSAAGVRTPRHAIATSFAEGWAAAERLGFPLVVKPVAGAGSVNTHRIDDAAQLDAALAAVGKEGAVLLEEFVDGEEYTFDALTIGGEVTFFNVAWYRPRPLVARTNEWVSPQTVCLRDVDAPELAAGRALGREVLRALGLRDGFTHMEWFRTAGGEAVFGEIAARPPGGHTVDAMNYACDADLFAGWGEAVVRGRLTQRPERRYNAALVFKRAEGSGRIQRIEGLESLAQRFGEYLVAVDLVPVGAPRRDWIQSLVSDGWVIVRHPDLATTLEMADAVGTELRLYAA